MLFKYLLSTSRFDSDVFTSPTASPGFNAKTPTTAHTPSTSKASPRTDAETDAGASGSGDDGSLTGVTGDLATLTAENSGFSDNEKTLLSQISRMQEEHKVWIY